MKKLKKCIPGIVFVIFFAGMGISETILPDKISSELEARTLSNKPEYQNWDRVFSGSLMDDVETYTGEQLPEREFFLEVEADIQRILGRKIVNNTMITKDGEYVSKTNIVDSFEKCTGKVEKLKKGLEENNIPFLFAVVGSKYNIYDEKELPYFRNSSGTLEKTNEFLNMLDTKGVATLSLYKPLKELKQAGISPYYKTDHHLNCEGAFTAYEVLANDLYQRGMISSSAYKKDEFYLWKDSHKFYGSALRGVGGTVLWNSDYDVVQQYLPKEGEYVFEYTGLEKREGNAEIFLFPDRYDEEEKYSNYYSIISRGYAGQPVFRNKSNTVDKTLVVLGDSFSQAILPILIKNCKNIYLIDVRAYQGSISNFAKSVNADGVVMLVATIENDRFKNLNP